MKRQSHPIAFYYGSGEIETLARYQRVVLQPGRYTPSELDWLRARGVVTLAYLSLGEDAGPPAPWHKGRRNPDWGTAYVDPSHPGWVASRLTNLRGSLEQGFGGLFLDTLDLADLYPLDRPALLSLIGEIRAATGSAYLLANRGFSLLPELADLIDGLVFEAFSTTWTLGRSTCRILPVEVLAINSTWAHSLRSFGLELYALDYVSNRAHSAFAQRRAARHGFSWFASNRSVTRLPEDLVLQDGLAP